MRRKPIVTPSGQIATGVRMLRLYVADGALNSVEAIANIKAICQQRLQGNYQLEVIDILEQQQFPVFLLILIFNRFINDFRFA